MKINVMTLFSRNKENPIKKPSSFKLNILKDRERGTRGEAFHEAIKLFSNLFIIRHLDFFWDFFLHLRTYN